MVRKKEGFNGQQIIILPDYIYSEFENNPLTKSLYPTDIGLYPNARYHYRERHDGCLQNILIYCIDGKGWIEINGAKYTVIKDQYISIPAHKPHRYGADDFDPWTIAWLHFSGDLSDRFVDTETFVRNIDLTRRNGNNDRIQLFNEVYQALAMGYSKENLEYSCICLWHFLGSFVYATQFQRIKEVKKHDLIEKSILFMHENINKNLTLEELASHCGFSASHFSMVFKKSTSRSPIEYFLGLKMQKACQMLDLSKLRVQEIADELSFQDPFYFSRLFRKTIGVSPAEYRKQKKG